MNLKGNWILIGFVIGAIAIIKSIRPVDDNRNNNYKTVTVMCDSVYYDENNDIIFAVRNKSDEHFYIDEKAARGLNVNSINKSCSLNVVSFEYPEKWSIMNMSGQSHSLSRIQCNDTLIWTRL